VRTQHDVEPYPDDRAFVSDKLAWLEDRLRIEVDRFEGPIDEFGALYVSEAQVRDLLWEDAADPTETSDGLDQRLTARKEEIDARRRATADAGSQLAMDRLVDSFDLDPVARDVLLIALAPDLDEMYATIYAYLQDDATRRRPTVGFILGLLTDDTAQLENRELFTAGSPLVDSELLKIEGSEPLPTRTVRLDERIAAFLLGEAAEDPVLSDVAAIRRPEELRSEQIECEPAVDLDQMDLSGKPPMVGMYGPPGTGKRDRVAALCRERGQQLLEVDTEYATSVAPSELLNRVYREARLRDAAVLFQGILDDEDATIRSIDRLDTLCEPVFLTGETTPSNAVQTVPTNHVFLPVPVERAAYPERHRIWAAQSELPAEVDPERLASTFRLSRGSIEDAVQMAQASACVAGEQLSADHIYEGCRSQSSEELSDLATEIDPDYCWDDIVLPSETAAQLREVANRVTDRGTVYTDWGFAKESSLGNGLVALFSGPSGTGKTMAAEIVANHAGLRLYKIDLAAIVSKYVGETESNLERVFDEAGDTDALVLFDEADAVFGDRSDVSDAQDRYANVEVDYLLQRVEEHDGSVLLTTNMESNIDSAFLRRIHVGVEFPLPDRQARAEIWRGVFPDDTPVGDLDYEYLSRLDLTGGSIRNVALTAAFSAAQAETAVDMEAVVQGVKREYQKTGTPIRPETFGEYSEIVEK
jgi:SpoVK/Ycf46/Vps4 family AAA+-type ATPase